jgi:hypothetical protein
MLVASVRRFKLPVPLCGHCRRQRLSPSTLYCHSYHKALEGNETTYIMPKCPVCKREFQSTSHLRLHVKRCQQLAGEAADARAARPTGSPPPVKSRRLRFLPSGRGGPTQRYEDRTNVDVVEGGVEADEQPFPDHMHTSTAPGEAAAASNPPVPENATKEEVSQALKGLLMDVADKTGENFANTLIKLLRHGSLDTSLLRVGVESARQIREEANDDAQHWLQHMHFEKVTVYDPKDPSTSGVSWFRCPIESLKRQLSKAGKGDVFNDPFVELNRAGTRI